MSRSQCASRVLGAALLIGALIGAAFAFVIVLAGLRSAPSALPDIASWLGSIRVSAVAALVGCVTGAITGAVSWSVGALVLLLIDLRKRALPVRASAVGIGSAVGALLVLWFVASRPGVSVSIVVIAVLVAVAGGLAIAALPLSERIGRRSVA